jgi:hypothetical protein
LPTLSRETLFNPDSLAERAPDSGSVFIFGQPAESQSGRRRRGRLAAPEQASLFDAN